MSRRSISRSYLRQGDLSADLPIRAVPRAGSRQSATAVALCEVQGPGRVLTVRRQRKRHKSDAFEQTNRGTVVRLDERENARRSMRPHDLHREFQTSTTNALTTTGGIDDACQRGPTVDIHLDVNQRSTYAVYGRNVELAMDRAFFKQFTGRDSKDITSPATLAYELPNLGVIEPVFNGIDVVMRNPSELKGQAHLRILRSESFEIAPTQERPEAT